MIKILRKIYHYLFNCYYSLASKEGGHREHAATGLISYFGLAIFIAINIWLNIKLGRTHFNPKLEGWAIFIEGIIIWLLNRFYFIRRKNYEEAISSYDNIPKYITISLGIFLLIFPMALFIYSGINMGAYIRSLK